MTVTTAEVEAPSRGPGRTRIVIAVVVVVVVAVAAAFWLRDHRRDQEWQHGGDPVRTQAHITATSVDGFGAALVAAGVPSEPGVSEAGQMFVLRVSWEQAPETDGRFEFILLDDRLDPPRPVPGYGAWGDDGPSGTNWSGAYTALADHYSWLAATAGDDVDALDAPATPTGEATLAYWLGKHAIPTSHPDLDLRLAMVFVDSDGEVRWARSVSLDS